MTTRQTLLNPGWHEPREADNGVSLHIVEAGLVGYPLLLLHGFTEFWWAWRKQITPLAEDGFRSRMRRKRPGSSQPASN